MNWIRQPLLDVTAIGTWIFQLTHRLFYISYSFNSVSLLTTEQRLDLVEVFYHDVQLRYALRVGFASHSLANTKGDIDIIS